MRTKREKRVFFDKAHVFPRKYKNLNNIPHWHTEYELIAVEKIKEGDKTMTEISRSCGFNTIRNFNRVFKDFTGYSPKNLPKSYRFVQDMREYTDKGFDPTLAVTSVVRT